MYLPEYDKNQFTLWQRFMIWFGAYVPCCGVLAREVHGWGRVECPECGRQYKSY